MSVHPVDANRPPGDQEEDDFENHAEACSKLVDSEQPRRVFDFIGSGIDVAGTMTAIPSGLQLARDALGFSHNIFQGLNALSLIKDWYEWINGGEERTWQKTASMAAITVLEALGVAKLLLRCNIDGLASIANTIGNIPVLGQGLGILQVIAYGGSLISHTQNYSKINLDIAEKSEEIQKIKVQLNKIKGLESNFEEFGEIKAKSFLNFQAYNPDEQLQEAIESDRSFSGEKRRTDVLVRGEDKLKYLETKYVYEIKLRDNENACSEIKLMKLRVSMISDINLFVMGILTTIGLSGVSALSVVGTPLIVLGLIFASFSLYKYYHNNMCDEEQKKYAPPPLPYILKAVEKAFNAGHRIGDAEYLFV